MATDPEGLVTFEAAGKKFTAVFGFKAMKAVEAHYDLPFFKALQSAMPSLSTEDAADPAKVMEAGASIRMTEIGRFFGFALLKHHSDLTETDVEEMIDEIGFEMAAEVIATSVAAALPKEGDGTSAGNPIGSRRKRTG